MMADISTLHGLAAALALVTAPASSQSAVPRAPTDKWVVDFADSQCTATRNYGSADKPLFLLFKPAPMGSVMQVAVLRKGKSGETAQVDAKLSVDQGQAIDTSLLAFTARKQGRRVNVINLQLDTFDQVREAKVLSISAAGEVNESFALTDVVPLMKAVDMCLADLRRVWNVGEAHNGRIKEGGGPKANLGSYFNADDYPDVAISGGETGTVELAMLIDEAGKIADCTVVATSGAAALDAQSCAVLTERAKFRPAVGNDGKPVKSSLTQRIRWDLENLRSHREYGNERPAAPLASPPTDR